MAEETDSLSRILVVDDDPHIRRIITDVLRKTLEYEVHSAVDGQAGLNAIREAESPFQLVITDMLMPRLNGIDLIRAAAAFDPSIAFAVITAHRNDRNVVSALSLGAVDYIEKPLSVDELVRTVRRLLQRRNRFQGVGERVEVRQELGGWVELTAPTDFEYVERFQRFTAMLGRVGLPAEVKDDIRIVVDELGQNAVEWGNRLDRSKRIHLSYCLFDDRLVFKFEDEGEGFNPYALPDPTTDPISHIRNRKDMGKRPGGFGVFLIQRLMDEVVYSDRGNIVVMSKYLRPEA